MQIEKPVTQQDLADLRTLLIKISAQINKRMTAIEKDLKDCVFDVDNLSKDVGELSDSLDDLTLVVKEVLELEEVEEEVIESLPGAPVVLEGDKLGEQSQ